MKTTPSSRHEDHKYIIKVILTDFGKSFYDAHSFLRQFNVIIIPFMDREKNGVVVKIFDANEDYIQPLQHINIAAMDCT